MSSSSSKISSLLLIIFLLPVPGQLVLGSKIFMENQNSLLPYDIVYDWKQIDFSFDSDHHRQQLIQADQFIPENCAITGIKVSGNRTFLTVPRWRHGVPATLLYLPYEPENKMANHSDEKLIPFPSWDLNALGNCSALQYVQSMEIDQFGRMWIADVGRVNILEEEPDDTCPPKLVIIELATNNIVWVHEFPADVVNRTSSFLNDLVIACFNMEECVAYISDAREAQIIVYDFAKDQSWFVKHSSMEVDPTALEIGIEGQNYTFTTAVDGIALSPFDTNFTTIFYSPLSSLQLYSVATKNLQNGANLNGFLLDDSMVTMVGTKSSQTDGMTVDANGLLYFGLLGDNAINWWDTMAGSLTDQNQFLVAKHDVDLLWADTFSIDERGFLYATTNRLHRYSTNTLDFSDTNFRILRFFIGAKSYMFPTQN